MFSRQFFQSDAWHNTVKRFRTERINPVLEVQCVDGESFTVYQYRAWRTCLVIEVYKEDNTYIKFLPYDFIKSIDLKEKSEELKFATGRPIGFKIPKEQEDSKTES